MNHPIARSLLLLALALAVTHWNIPAGVDGPARGGAAPYQCVVLGLLAGGFFVQGNLLGVIGTMVAADTAGCF